MDVSDILLAGIFFILAIFVQVIGVIIADWRNHKRELERLKIEHHNKIDYLLSETFFKKKLEYFEKITKFIEEYLQYYSQLMFLINNPQQSAELANLPKIKGLADKKLIKKSMSKVLSNIKEDKFINLLPSGHTLYLNSGILPTQISSFVLNHTRLFTLTAQYLEEDLKDDKKKTEIVQLISQNIISANNLTEGLKNDLVIIRKPKINNIRPIDSLTIQKLFQ